MMIATIVILATTSVPCKTGVLTESEVRTIVEQQVDFLGYDWGEKSQDAVVELIFRESRYNSESQNPNSTAYGLGQFLNSTWKGVGIKKTDCPDLQVQAMLRYIKMRKEFRGSPVTALRLQKIRGYY